MKTSVFFILLLFSFGFTKSENINDLFHLEFNKINPISPQLLTFIEELKQTNTLNNSIVHIGDSHIQIGEFSKGIKEAFEQEQLALSDGWFLPSGIFHDLYHPYFEVKRQSNPFKTENLKTINPQLNLGLTGRTFLLDSKENKIKCKSEVAISKIEFLHENTPFLAILLKKCFFKNKLVKLETKILSEKYAITTLILAKATKRFKLQFKNLRENPIAFYAMRINHEEQKTSYSNFGVSGANFEEFTSSKELYPQLEVLRPKLILVTLGTNDSYIKDLDTTKFKENLNLFIHTIKQILPHTEIIFMTAPDTKYLGNKPPHLFFVNKTITNTCKTLNIPLWDWYKVLGGENSIDDWEKQGFSSGDYLHFSAFGYRKIGELFGKALLTASEN